MVLGDTDSYMPKKNEIQPPTYTIHKNKLMVDKILKHKLKNHKGPRREHRLENHRYYMQQYIHQYVLYGKGHKGNKK